MHIRVVRSDGRRVRPRHALIRLGAMAISLPLFWGYLPILTSARRRGVPDVVAGTVVVVADAPDEPAAARLRPARMGLPRTSRRSVSSTKWDGPDAPGSVSASRSARLLQPAQAPQPWRLRGAAREQRGDGACQETTRSQRCGPVRGRQARASSRSKGRRGRRSAAMPKKMQPSRLIAGSHHPHRRAREPAVSSRGVVGDRSGDKEADRPEGIGPPDEPVVLGAR